MKFQDVLQMMGIEEEISIIYKAKICVDIFPV